MKRRHATLGEGFPVLYFAAKCSFKRGARVSVRFHGKKGDAGLSEIGRELYIFGTGPAGIWINHDDTTARLARSERDCHLLFSLFETDDYVVVDARRKVPSQYII